MSILTTIWKRVVLDDPTATVCVTWEIRRAIQRVPNVTCDRYV